MDFFPEPPEDPVDPEVGGGGTEVGVCCDIAETTLDHRRRRRGRECQAPSDRRGSIAYVLEDGDGIVVVVFRLLWVLVIPNPNRSKSQRMSAELQTRQWIVGKNFIEEKE